MKKKFYNFGTFINTRYQKNGAEVGIAMGVGALVSGVIGSSVAASSNESINSQNIQLAQENNELAEKLFHEGNQFNAEQAQIARDFNSKEASIARDFNAQQAAVNREFMASQFEKAMQYNSIGAQVERARDAGVNPASILGGSSTPVTSIPSGSTASASAASVGSPTSQGVPSLQLPNLHSNAGIYSNLLNNITSAIGDVVGSVSEVNRNTNQLTLNKFTKLTQEAGLKFTEAQTKELYSRYNVNMKTLDEIQSNMDKNVSIMRNLDAETRGKYIENFFKSDFYQKSIDKMAQDINQSKTWCDYTVKRSVLEFANIQADTYLKNEQSSLYKAEKEFTEQQKNQSKAFTSLLTTQGSREQYQLLLDMEFGIEERQAGLDYSKERITDAQFHNSGLGRGLDAFKDITVGFAAGAVGYKSLKSPKGGNYKPSDNYTPSTNYFAP